MKKKIDILGKTYSYTLEHDNTIIPSTRTVVFNAESLGKIYCRGKQQNGYSVEERPDIEIGHSMNRADLQWFLDP